MTGMPFSVEVLDGVAADEATVIVIGEIDLVTAPQLWAALEPLTANHRSIVIDVGEVAFMDSTGINVLARTRRKGAEVRLRGVNDNVRRLLEITGLDTVVTVEE